MSVVRVHLEDLASISYRYAKSFSKAKVEYVFASFKASVDMFLVGGVECSKCKCFAQ